MFLPECFDFPISMMEGISEGSSDQAAISGATCIPVLDHGENDEASRRAAAAVGPCRPRSTCGATAGMRPRECTAAVAPSMEFPPFDAAGDDSDRLSTAGSGCIVRSKAERRTEGRR